MDGIHDMGGKQGFGAVDVVKEATEQPFHHDWEGRMWAISRNCRADDWTIDWWRHVRERIDPVDYLTRPYFDSWMQTSAAAFILSGVFTLEEIISGHTTKTGPAAAKQDQKAALQANRQSCREFSTQNVSAPLFSVGDPVQTTAFSSNHHSRLPQYARAKPGVIHAHHGSHLFADAGAKGEHIGQHLYTVGFPATALWGPKSNPNDTVFLDLWESHLEQP